MEIFFTRKKIFFQYVKAFNESEISEESLSKFLDLFSQNILINFGLYKKGMKNQELRQTFENFFEYAISKLRDNETA